jgi:hypothetical protein
LSGVQNYLIAAAENAHEEEAEGQNRKRRVQTGHYSLDHGTLTRGGDPLWRLQKRHYSLPHRFLFLPKVREMTTCFLLLAFMMQSRGGGGDRIKALLL